MKLPGKGMGWKRFFELLGKEISHDNVTTVAGAVTYSGLLALFPFLLFLVSLASLIITPQQAESVVQQLGRVAPQDVTSIVGGRIREIASTQRTGLLTAGAIGAIWAASGGIATLIQALNMVYGVQEGRPFWKTRGIAIGMTLLAGVLALVAALVAVVSPALASAVGGPIGTAILWARLPVAGLVVMLLWSLLYYVLPDVEQEFRFITPGSVSGVIIWILASWGFSEYVSNFGSYASTYGSLGGIIVLLLWMWISSLVLLAGAEVNAVIEQASPEGKKTGAKRRSDKGATPTKTEAPSRSPAPEELARAFRQGFSAGRAAMAARSRAGAALVALLAGALWLRRRES